MLPGAHNNPCGTTWFIRRREEDALPLSPGAEMVRDGCSEGPVDSVHLSGPQDEPPLPTEVKLPKPKRSPFDSPRLTSGERAVGLAYKHKNKLSNPSLRKALPRFQAAGGATRNCADFVSAVQQDTGRLVHHYNTVPGLEKGLQHEGWVAIPAREARPGDVWTNGTHAEIVARPGGTRLIGSNNGGHWYQTITDHAQDPSQGRYWGRR